MKDRDSLYRRLFDTNVNAFYRNAYIPTPVVKNPKMTFLIEKMFSEFE